MEHPSEETLKRFASGAATLQEKRDVVAHLLKGCVDCSAKLRSFLEPQPLPRQKYDDILDRFDRRLLEALEKSVNPGEALAGLPWRASTAASFFKVG